VAKGENADLVPSRHEAMERDVSRVSEGDHELAEIRHDTSTDQRVMHERLDRGPDARRRLPGACQESRLVGV